MKNPGDLPQKISQPERLFPFVIRARKLLVGREVLARSKSKLQFILVTTDLSDSSRDEILGAFPDYPIIQKYTAQELESFFSIRNAKVIGFAKSSLAKSIYSELKESRINKPRKEPDGGKPDQTV